MDGGRRRRGKFFTDRLVLVDDGRGQVKQETFLSSPTGPGVKSPLSSLDLKIQFREPKLNNRPLRLQNTFVATLLILDA